MITGIKNKHGIMGDYALWRRSALIVCAVFGTVALALALRGLVDRFDSYNRFVDSQKAKELDYRKVSQSYKDAVAEMNKDIKSGSVNASDVTESLISIATFSGATIDNLTEETKAVVRQKQAVFSADMFAVIMLGVSVMLVWGSVFCWHKFRLSSFLVSMAWLFTYLVPFLIALVPFASFNPATALWKNTLKLTDEFSSLVTSQKETLTDQNFDAIAQVNEAAYLLLTFVPDFMEDLIDKLDFVIGNIIMPLEPVIKGARFGVQMLVKLMPAAISLLPSLMKSCILVRALFPTSCEAGYFAALIPYLNVPLAIAMWSLAFQVIPDWRLIVGILLIALSPLPMGLFSQGLMRCTTTQEFVKAITMRKRVSMLFSLGALVLVLLHFFESPFRDDILESFSSSALISLVFNFLRSSSLTMIFTCDAVVRVVAGIRQFYQLVESKGQLKEKLQSDFDVMEYTNTPSYQAPPQEIELVKK